MFKIVASQSANEERWKRERRRYLTGSDVFKFLPQDVLLRYGWWVEQWMARDYDGQDHDLAWARRDVLTRKVTGEEPFFGDPVKVRWGRAEEGHFRDRFAEYSGLVVGQDHSLIVNDRWPYIAASLDAWVVKRDTWLGLAHQEMFVEPKQVIAAVEALPSNEAMLLEMKTTSDFGISTWLKGTKTQPRSKIVAGKFVPQPAGVPVYYRPQVLTQMAITGISHCITVVQGGLSSMTAHTVEFGQDWNEVLDIVNHEIADNIKDIRGMLDGKE
jgi:hypothetical protein